MSTEQAVREDNLLFFYFIATFCPKTTKNTLFLVLLYKYCLYEFCKQKIKNQTPMNGLLEILTNKQWMIRPEFVHGMMPVIQNNLNNHIELGEEKKHDMGCRIVFTKEGTEARIKEERYSAKDGRYISSWNDNKDDPFINVMFVGGPITRNGGACSYGSVQHRDMMMTAADNANCVGHIFHINTPGGSAWAKNDYQQAIDYARSKKQPVVAFIDGMCCSAGMYLAALCDQRYYMHAKDEIGCIGVMAAFYTEKDGTTCQFTNETYHELYDPESFDKNKEFRDVANDGNTKLLVEELAKLGVEFRADVKKACPNAKEEHLHGKVFDAQDVKGILMDDQKSLGEVFNIVIDRGVKNGLQSAKNALSMLNPNNTTINMKEKFPAVFALLGIEEMQMQEGGAFMNEGLLATLNANIEAMQKEKADAQASVQSLTAEKNELTDKVEEMTAQAETKETEHTKAIDDLNAAHATAIEEKDNQISALEQEKADLQAKVDENATSMETLNAELTTAKESLTTAQNTIAERDQQITDLNATIDEMKQEPGEGAQAGSPANNGAGADGLHQASGAPQWDPTLSATENKQRMEAYEAELKKYMR